MEISVQPSLSDSVRDLASRSTTVVHILESYEIDYYCDPEDTLEIACNRSGYPPAVILNEIQSALQAKHTEDVDWTQTPLRDLIAHIVTTHHEYLKRELPRLTKELQDIYRSATDPARTALIQLPGLLDALMSELESHMHKEEMILFPYIERYESAVEAGRPTPHVPFGTVANPIAMMEHEHNTAIAALRSMRTSTGGYAVRHELNDDVRALYAALQELESDLHIHIHFENNILFPRALDMESRNR